MADALVSLVLEQLTSVVGSKLQEELKLHKDVETKIQKLITDFQTIREVLDDAEKRRVKEPAVENWVDELKQVCYDMEDVLDEWRTATILKQQLQPAESASSFIKKVTSWTSSYLPGINRTVWKRDIALKITDINQRLDAVVNEKNRFKFTTGTTANEPERPKTTSFVDVSEIYGRDHVKESLTNRLLSESSLEKQNLPITAIVGMGGIGKTTLAQLAYNDENIKQHFDKRIWVCVSNPFNATNIARAIIEGLKGRTSDLTELQSMLQEISEAIKNREFLLILDDVWNEDHKMWEPLRNCLKNGSKGSKILVTSRSEKVASIMEATNTIHLEELSAEECWSIFSKIAFSGRSKEERKALEEIGWKISERCKGLPLAAKVLGGLMRLKRSRLEWQNVLDSDLWELEEANKELDPVFMLSYYDLPSPLKRCFTYCAIFPEDDVIERDHLVQLWMANRFLKGREMEITGEEYIESLAMRSLFQDLYRDPHSGRIVQCKMHDLVREFALRVSRNECGEIEVYKDEEELMMKQEPAYAKLRHARVTFEGGGHSSHSALSKFSINGLRTLLIAEFKVPELNVLGGLMCSLTSLRTLVLRRSNIEELPLEIGKLMHLRYLGLEDNVCLEALPKTVCDLFNLQTLNLSSCSKIKRLPRGIGQLLNLRHLEVGDIKLPKEIGKLTSLRALSWDGVTPNGEEYFGMGDLEKLNSLGGVLRLKNLGEVRDAVGEAKRARLKKKKNLQSLYLDFSRSTVERCSSIVEASDEERVKRHLLIAEAFEEPPPYLQELKFEYYEGTELPSWIASLSRLETLTLSRCPHLKELPETVCDLFNLQTLKLSHCYEIERLPRGIGKLLNLRHLEFEHTGIKKLPKGVGELTSLRTLTASAFYKREGEEECFGIGDLEKLNSLKCISLVLPGNVEFDDVGEAKRARLKNKKNLRSLSLNFDGSSGGVAEERAKRHLLIAEALLEEEEEEEEEEEATPPYLERLEFCNYEGTELPSWITSLSRLKSFLLWFCTNLKELPGDFLERLPPLLCKVEIARCETLEEFFKRNVKIEGALRSVFRFL